MRRNYKAFFFITVAYIVMVVLSNATQFAKLYSTLMSGRFVYLIIAICHLLISVTIIFTLKNFREGTWRLVPFVLSAVAGVLIFTANFFYKPGLSPSSTYYYSLQGLVFGAIGFYTIISCFFVKSIELATFFRIYAGSLILTYMFSLSSIFIYRFDMNLLVVYRYLQSAVGLIPAMVIAVLYYQLYTKVSTFKQGDLVLSNKDIENVPGGSLGIIIAKHPDAGYYEVEFSDENGNLINVLTVTSNDIQFAPMPDLQSQVDDFGK